MITRPSIWKISEMVKPQQMQILARVVRSGEPTPICRVVDVLEGCYRFGSSVRRLVKYASQCHGFPLAVLSRPISAACGAYWRGHTWNCLRHVASYPYSNNRQFKSIFSVMGINLASSGPTFAATQAFHNTLPCGAVLVEKSY